jgi:purine-binding chemotaxis protein CheW
MDKILTFYLCERLFGIDITLVKEINRSVEHTPVPDTDSHIVGLFNMRGQIVTLFDISEIMGYEQKNWGQRSACVILKAQSGDLSQVGFLIDRCGDVLDIEEEECELPPANVGGVSGEFISSVAKLQNDLLLIIDPGKLFVEKK